MRRPSGLTLILAATAVASIAGFVVIVVVPRTIGFDEYKPFGVFWSAMYLVVSALSGIQQEVTRGTVARRPEPGLGPNPARNFALVAAAGTLVAIAATSPLWADALFPEEGWTLVPPLAVACASYVMVATLAGTLYGISRWNAIAAMISLDALLRLTAVVVVSQFTSDTVALAWAAALPFIAAIAMLWPVFRHSVVGRTALDVSYRSLSWNVTRSVVASTSAGVLVSGLPVVIGIAGQGIDPARIASLFVVITLTRAPIIVLVMSLQSYLVVRFRDHPGTFWRSLATMFVAILGGGLLASGLAAVIGPPVFDVIYAGSVDFSGPFYAVLVLSSALIGCLCVTGPAALALSDHRAYSLGWLTAAVLTAAAFLLPIDFMARVVVALLAGPAAGFVLQLAFLAVRRRDSARPVDS